MRITFKNVTRTILACLLLYSSILIWLQEDDRSQQSPQNLHHVPSIAKVSQGNLQSNAINQKPGVHGAPFSVFNYSVSTTENQVETFQAVSTTTKGLVISASNISCLKVTGFKRIDSIVIDIKQLF